jgi:hypothetical protein
LGKGFTVLGVKIENVKILGLSFCIPKKTVETLGSDAICGGNKQRQK